uniref:Carbonic anhydrase n=1 Tax=Electrophorus electricus TaxID=8005 RepID=A0A4W4DWL9_ELEEL
IRIIVSYNLYSDMINLTLPGDWCYQAQVNCNSTCKGPDIWYKVHKDCNSHRQSPINIVTKSSRPDTRLTPLVFTGYQKAFRAVLRNDGHSVKVTLPHGSSVSGGNLQGIYNAVQFHFHWGEKGGPGSEHTLDGEQYPMELHIVHMRNDFSSLDEAIKDPSGVAVLGFFYEVESKSPNRKYDAFIHALKAMENDTTTNSEISLHNLILSEANMTQYFRYDGSLTTPTCSEAVIWTVFEHPIPLGRDQLLAFSSLKYSDGMPMVKTFRPVQPRRGRPVYRSCSSSSVAVGSLAPLLVSVSAALGLSQLN